MELHAQLACSMPIELLKKGVSWQERAVYSEAILYCRANLTDGVIHRALLPLWMPDLQVSDRVKRLNAMVTKGALLAHPEGWEFPPHVWSRWNPSRAQVDAKRAEEAARKQEYRERRRQVSQESPNGTSPGQVRTLTDRDAPVPTMSQPCPRQPEPEPEPEPYSLHPQDEFTRDMPVPVDISEWAERRQA